MATPPNPLPRKALGLVGEAMGDLESAVRATEPLLARDNLEIVIRTSRAMERIRRAQLKLKDAQQIGKMGEEAAA